MHRGLIATLILAGIVTSVAVFPSTAKAVCFGWAGQTFWCDDDWYVLSRGGSPTPTATATATPTRTPTATPSTTPTPAPTTSPTATPTPAPTASPTPSPTASPTPAPTASPTPAPTSGKVLQDFAVPGTGKTIPVYSSRSLSVTDTRVTHAVVAVHGTNRNATDYFDYAKAAVSSDVLVVAPRFMDSTDNPSSSQLYWTNAGWKQGDNDQRGAGASSFEVMDALISALHDGFPNLATVVVAGHSAGGQFTQRYAATSTDARTHFVVANPSSYLYMSDTRPNGSGFSVPSTSCSSYNDYKYGLERLSVTPYMSSIGASTLRARYAQSRVTYLLGGADTDPNAADLDTTCEAELQGAFRLERGEQFFDHLATVYGSGIYQRHTKSIVAGVGHSARDMFGSSAGRAALAD